jgi:hypothetical protein
MAKSGETFIRKHASPIDDDDPVGNLIYLVQVVCGKEHRRAVFMRNAL